jgi:hypothetical protein
LSAQRKVSGKGIEVAVKDRPYAQEVLQTQLLYDIASMIEELTESSKTPKGFVFPIIITVQETTTIDFVKEMPREPLFSITIFNDGPDDVYPSVNTYQKYAPLKPGESLSIDFRKPGIEKLYLDVDTGKKANIRGFGIY